MSHEIRHKSVVWKASGVVIVALAAIWQFYVFVTFKSAAGGQDLQGGKAHLWWAIAFGVIAFIGAFLIISTSMQYDRGSEMHITSPPASRSVL
jgi:protein-S-isoprenylcysteine O-methyltransferase Ste14